MDDPSEAQESEQKQDRLGPLRIIGSVLAAAFGVQSRENRERDFKEGRFVTFIIMGVVVTALFVGTIYLVVTTVLENAR